MWKAFGIVLGLPQRELQNTDVNSHAKKGEVKGHYQLFVEGEAEGAATTSPDPWDYS